METVKKILEIKLKSDLLCASGLGSANIIDIDVSLLDNGLPYIPGKRIKGILRDAFCEEKDFGMFQGIEVSDIFGDIGGKFSTVKIGNAYIKGSDEITEYLSSPDQKFKNFLNNSTVTDYYSYLRTRTTVEDGVAKDGSLRSMRVIAKDNKFCCNIEMLKSEVDIINQVCKAVKHIGMSRNRGLGEVMFSLSDVKEKVPFDFDKKIEEDKSYKLKLLCENSEDIAVADFFGNGTDYICGSSLLGYFAGWYIKKYGDKSFNDIFLDGNLIFSNMYISNKNGNEYFPLPSYFMRDKNNGKKIYNRAAGNPSVAVKSLNGKYGAINGNIIELAEIKKTDNYHIATENGCVKDGGLYTYDAIKKGQFFNGEILGQGKYIKYIVESLKENPKIKIGKSKTSQYGNLDVKAELNSEDKQQTLKTKKFALQFISDLILFDGKGNNDVSIANLKEVLSNVFDVKTFTFYVNAGTVGGFNNKWNTQRNSYNVITKGSSVIIELNEEQNINCEYYLGEFIYEGYGKAVITSFNELKEYSLKSKVKVIDNSVAVNTYVAPIIAYGIYENIYNKITDNTLKKSNNFKDASYNSIIGNARVILKTAKDYESFYKELGNIKDEAKKAKAQNLFSINESEINNIIAEEISALNSISSEINWGKIKMQYVNSLITAVKYAQRKTEA